MRRTIVLLASMAVALVLASGAAFAVVTLASGGAIDRVSIVRQDEAFTTSSTSYVDIPNTQVGVTVPAGTTRLIMARFSAESTCVGGSGFPPLHYCSMTIVAVNAGSGAVTELQPASGLDFAFDSTDANTESIGSWESHSMDRSLRLGAGSYRIKPQAAVSNSATRFTLDDYSFTVERAQ
jgi:hypothetical protein